MSLIVHAEAQAEIDKEAAYLEGVRPGLGHDFLLAVNGAVRLAAAVPRVFSRVKVPGDRREIRRVLVQGFRYNVFFEVHAAGIGVLAVAHHRRRPFYWARRQVP